MPFVLTKYFWLMYESQLLRLYWLSFERGPSSLTPTTFLAEYHSMKSMGSSVPGVLQFVIVAYSLPSAGISQSQFEKYIGAFS